MTQEQQRIAIALSQGLTDEEWICANGEWCFSSLVPDYINDLNAIHEVEKSLTDEQLFVMSRWLQHITRSTFIGVAVMTASAPQRAEAFLKTIDKWTNNQPTEP